MNFNFTEEEINVILQGLSELPAKKSFHLIVNIQSQYKENMNEEIKEE